jgi:hypothetical protein
MTESMRWARKIEEEILVGQKKKEKGRNKNREGFLGC